MPLVRTCVKNFPEGLFFVDLRRTKIEYYGTNYLYYEYQDKTIDGTKIDHEI